MYMYMCVIYYCVYYISFCSYKFVCVRAQKVRLFVENKWFARRAGGCVFTARRKYSRVLCGFLSCTGPFAILFSAYIECIVFLLQPLTPFSFRWHKSLFYGKHNTAAVYLWKLLGDDTKIYSRGIVCAYFIRVYIYIILFRHGALKNIIVEAVATGGHILRQ